MDKVLIVDDDVQLLAILKEAFSQYQNRFEVITAQDGLAAIIALRKQPISLVVTGIRMPIVNGLVLLAYMAKNYPKVPCIVMTGHGTPFLKKRLKQETAYYLDKPFRVKELARAVLSVLGQREVLWGTLKGISVIGFAHLIETESITCLCEITTPEGEKGYLLFDDGVLYNAFYTNLKGEEAAVTLLQLEGATIRFKQPPKKQILRRIEKPLSALLQQAMASVEKR
jgi:DNA-binding response OmpR family regulator